MSTSLYTQASWFLTLFERSFAQVKTACLHARVSIKDNVLSFIHLLLTTESVWFFFETERRKHLSDMAVWLYDTHDRSKKVSLRVVL